MIRLSIKRPVAVTMVYVCVALLGVAAWTNVSVERLPNVSFPQLSLSFSWPGASPETVEAFATSPIESAVQQVKGVERITSVTSEQQGSITVVFARETDMDFARLDLSERLTSLEEQLPEGVSGISVQAYVPREFQEQEEAPFLDYTFTGPFLLEALALHLNDVLRPELMKIQGVSDVWVDGGRPRLIEIELDPVRISALGLRPQMVSAAINQLELVRDVGAVREGEMEWAMTIRSRPVSALDLRQALLPIPGGPDAPQVRLEDVGIVRDTFQDPTSHFRIDGSPAVRFRVVKEYGVNTVRLAETVRARVDELASLNPPGTQFILNRDASEDVQRELTDLRTRALIAAGVIFVVLLGFLRSFRTAGIVFATIVFSILIALNLIYFGGMTLNLLTLMGLALGFGLIVDNAIVVLENVYRKWQDGADPVEASEKGARDVVLPIMASTATTLIVFFPFLYLQGESRIYYLPLATVVGLTLIASIFVAFTFIPALAARLLGRGRKARVGRDALKARGAPIYIRFYQSILGYTLRFPWVTVMVAAVCLGASYYVFNTYVSRGALWGGGSGQQRSTVNIRITMPRGSDMERVDELTRYFEDRLALMPEVERFTTNVSGTQSSTTVSFPLELELTPIPLVIQERLFAFSLGFTGAEVRVTGIGPAFYGGSGGASPNYRITILGYNYERLAEIAADLGARLSVSTRVQNMDTNASSLRRDRAVEYVADIDRDAAARQGVNVQEVVSLLNSSLRGSTGGGSVTLAGDPIRYEVRLEGYRQADVQDLLETVVAMPTGTRIPVGQLIQVRERNVLTEIRRENQQYERTVAYEFRGPRPLGDVIRDAALDATDLPPGYQVEVTNTGFITREDSRQLMLVLLVAIGLIFMVTAGLFESIRQPLCVLLAVPMALIGVFLTFFYVRATFTREAYVGVIMMGGIVVNNAILLVDHINRVRSERGELPLQEAIVQGTLERVRPILMTTATTVLGLLPLVLFMPTADARIWNALTYSLIGGLLSSTLFVLTTSPALYYLFERGPARKRAAALEPAPGLVRTGIALLLVLAATSACVAGTDAGPEPDGPSEWTLGAEPTLQIGLQEGAPEYTFASIASVWRRGDGSIVVAESRSRQLRIYDAAGAFANAFGARGEGPGEFVSLSLAGPYRGDSIFVWDSGSRRISVFDREGGFGRSDGLRSPTPEPGGDVRIVGASTARILGAFVNGEFAMIPPSYRTTEDPEVAPEVQVWRYAAEGEPIQVLTTFERGSVTLSALSQEYVRLSFPFGPGPIPSPPFVGGYHAAVGPTRMYVGPGLDYEILVVGVDGTVENMVRSSHRDRTVTGEMRDAFGARVRRDFPDAAPNVYEPFVEGVPYPEVLPPYDAILVDAEGDLWVRDYWSGESLPTWVVFDPEGERIASLITDERLDVHDIGTDYLLGVWEDELEVPYIRLYNLTRQP